MSINLENDPSNGRILMQFTLPEEDQDGPVSVVGSFNDWSPGTDLLIAHGDGTIGATVAVEPGSEVLFRYLGSHGRWFDEPDADEVTDRGNVIRIPTSVRDPGTDPAADTQRPVEAPSAASVTTAVQPPDSDPPAGPEVGGKRRK